MQTEALTKPEPMPLDVQILFAHWETTPAVPRIPCPCGRAYIVDDMSGRPCDECVEEAMREAAIPDCWECGDERWIWHRDAVCFADERAAQVACHCG